MRTIRIDRETIPSGWRRTGAALPLVLICMVLAMGMGAAMIRSVLIQHRRTQLAGQQTQSMWLAESGVQRAMFQLQRSPKYRGEVWEISAATLGGTDSGRVTIEIESRDGDTRDWAIHVEAIYPDHPRHRVVQHREVVVLEAVEASKEE